MIDFKALEYISAISEAKTTRRLQKTYLSANLH